MRRQCQQYGLGRIILSQPGKYNISFMETTVIYLPYLVSEHFSVKDSEVVTFALGHDTKGLTEVAHNDMRSVTTSSVKGSSMGNLKTLGREVIFAIRVWTTPSLASGSSMRNGRCHGHTTALLSPLVEVRAVQRNREVQLYGVQTDTSLKEPPYQSSDFRKTCATNLGSKMCMIDGDDRLGPVETQTVKPLGQATQCEGALPIYSPIQFSPD
ncbi:hypothetical protein ACRALDRAFT_213187 [Sodiomyces alcalophilus JCM 7366]|uniref:uncharacterized protein n=1 Tax=Sodiomyces alcalophilus JCM 7366 TaxID=591952 RepID=UPI0039B3F08D